MKLWATAFVLAAMLPLGSAAQSAQPVTTAVTGQLEGPDRTAQLIAGAKAEKTVAVYSSVRVDAMADIVRAFEKKYGVKVDLWRGTAADILARVTAETRGGRRGVDVVEGASADIEPLDRMHLFQDVRSPFFADLMPTAVVQGRPWVSARLSVFVVAYNTKLVRPAELPKSYEDLVNWKGKIGIEAGDANWLMAMADAMGEDRAVKLLRAVAAKPGFSPRVGHTLLANLVASGEISLSLTIYTDAVEELKKTGAPIEMLPLQPMPTMYNALGVMKDAPHPYAAMLFLDFFLSDAQPILAAHHYPTTNRKAFYSPSSGVYRMMDSKRYIDESAKWNALFKDIITPKR